MECLASESAQIPNMKFAFGEARVRLLCPHSELLKDKLRMAHSGLTPRQNYLHRWDKAWPTSERGKQGHVTDGWELT